jgi:hypothetical protein
VAGGERVLHPLKKSTNPKNGAKNMKKYKKKMLPQKFEIFKVIFKDFLPLQLTSCCWHFYFC